MVGTYEYLSKKGSFRWLLNEDSSAEYYMGEDKYGEEGTTAVWTLEDADKDGKQELRIEFSHGPVTFYHIEDDGSLRWCAAIKNGRRHECREFRNKKGEMDVTIYKKINNV